jgi:IclR family mhp operon transcriptional activator
MPTLIQSISRCLNVLEALNLRNGATIAELCAQTGLTRGTVYRILETLKRDGFLRKDEGSAHYWLAARVRRLSDGYQDEWWIDTFARDIIVQLGQTIRWPVKLLTPSGHDMLTRATTDFSSPFTDGKYPTGLRLAMPWSAAGRA